MNRAIIRPFIVVLACIAAAASTGAQRSSPAGAGVPRLAERLAGLDPTDPMMYFELAEDVAYEIPTAAGRKLATELYVLAYSINAEAPASDLLPRSVCLALADLTTDAEGRRWLLALAATLTPDHDGPSWRIERAQLGADNALLEVAELLGDARRAENQRVKRGLGRLAIEQMLLEHGVAKSETAAIVAELAIASGNPPRCPDCRNERIVRTREGTEMDVEICPRCGGNPGPAMNAEHFLAHLRAEGILLDAQPQSWSGQLLLTRARPLRDIDPGDLAVQLGVDPDARTWNAGDADPAGGIPDGAWVKAPG